MAKEKTGISFLDKVSRLRGQGKKEESIAKDMGLSLLEFRRRYALEASYHRMEDIDTVKGMTEDGLSVARIARGMGKTESYVRHLLSF